MSYFQYSKSQLGQARPHFLLVYIKKNAHHSQHNFFFLNLGGKGEQRNHFTITGKDVIANTPVPGIEQQLRKFREMKQEI